uniref:Uncharacterized protein n=1 Tax=Phaeomonas parva TaxID=124430 RepID=A0A6U4HM95_9STRA|mmetsp:Transcript_36774/g.115165  ORF Transcript_36774/g.115165 Transcript_36774/m.115165 type:complete len:321 (+) Transcript_36774:268-1230(+)|eukprot:CAMPEP_0118878366 /NCGR_PEP_ID=MMETSP1163-20130328/18289_1 /TAXON_ID=124430 /ORGANISM="Phaeomonas parva, Strain CCMP2877" /LENGTH=320 /DNA_ID=CAMNT_0006814179 /DNA_START=235 /DNA_END=1197 /DNA_ORIENTATION=+
MTDADVRAHSGWANLEVDVDSETVQRLLAMRSKLEGLEESSFGFNLTEHQRMATVVVVVAACAFYVILSLRASVKARRLALAHVLDETVATSRRVSPLAMLLWRSAAAVFIFASYFSGWATSSPRVKFMRVSTFTCWSWFMMGVYFCVAALATLLHMSGRRLPSMLKATIWAMFEALTPVSILVCLVVWFVLIPMFQASNNVVALRIMFSWFGLAAHNANVVLMAVELLLNRLSFNDSHMPFVIIYGLVYLAFAMYLWRATGVLFYFFLDYTLPFAWVAYLALLGVIVASFKVTEHAAGAIKKRETPKSSSDGAPKAKGA